MPDLRNVAYFTLRHVFITDITTRARHDCEMTLIEFQQQFIFNKNTTRNFIIIGLSFILEHLNNFIYVRQQNSVIFFFFLSK